MENSNLNQQLNNNSDNSSISQERMIKKNLFIDLNEEIDVVSIDRTEEQIDNNLDIENTNCNSIFN